MSVLSVVEGHSLDKDRVMVGIVSKPRVIETMESHFRPCVGCRYRAPKGGTNAEFLGFGLELMKYLLVHMQVPF